MRSVWDREVGGSNPLAPTNTINNLLLPALAAVSIEWGTYDQNSENPFVLEAEQPECSAKWSSNLDVSVELNENKLIPVQQVVATDRTVYRA